MQLRRLAFLLIVLTALALALPVDSADAQSKTLYWRRWDSNIRVLPANGNLAITEEHEIAFTSGQFRFGVLTIPMERIEGIRNVQIQELDPSGSGQWIAYSEQRGERPGTFYTLRNGGSFEIDYFFLAPPAERETRTMRVSYEVEGALRYYEGGDQVWWEAVGALGWPVNSSTVIVDLPKGAAPREGIDPVVSYGTPTNVSVQGTRVTFTTTAPSNGQTPLEVRVQFPHGVVQGAPASWQAAYDRQADYDSQTRPLLNLILGAIGLLLIVGGPVGVYMLWRARGRDPEFGPVPEYLSEPPADLPPAVVGTLIDEQADLQDVISTLVDLARRGYLIMEEEKEQGLFTSSTVFSFERTDKPTDDLRPFEKTMLDRLMGNEQRRSMSSLNQKFYTTIPKIQDQLYKEVVREGFFSAEPDSVRMLWAFAGGGLIFLAVAVGFFAMPMAGSIAEALTLLPIGIGVTGVALTLVASSMPAKTRKGAEQSALWRAFRTYLQRIDKYTDLEAATDQFDRYLPYAIAFGMERSWISKFSRVQTPVPFWYYPYGWRRAGYYHPGHYAPGGGASQMGQAAGGLAGQVARPTGGLQDMSDSLAGGLQNISNGLTSMLNSASRTFTSRPQSAATGSSGSWSRGGSSWSGGGGGGGFGGGASGGGRGGGFG
ncbi:MAG: DUF2207 domain-containing protein [Anaerolineae bacterium]|nr:DUF2207 domain-containing protein [Anaerolineae bacterium]